jgi:hypothetical protein
MTTLTDYTAPQSGLVTAAPNVLKPKCAITIAVHTAYVVSAGGGSTVSSGIYMMDNEVQHPGGGGRNEGGMELHTYCNVGDLIGFNTVPINAYNGDTVVITGFQVEPNTRDVFTSQGMPIQQSASGDYWIGQAMQAGDMTYQIKIKVTHGILRPTVVYVTWDPFITAQ